MGRTPQATHASPKLKLAELAMIGTDIAFVGEHGDGLLHARAEFTTRQPHAVGQPEVYIAIVNIVEVDPERFSISEDPLDSLCSVPDHEEDVTETYLIAKEFQVVLQQ